MSYRYNWPSLTAAAADMCFDDDNAINVAMTFDAGFLRSSIAAILSVLQHSSCPENIVFHFVASSAAADDLRATIAASFPYLRFQIYPFDDSTAEGLISTSIRAALDCPLNYARNYLAELLPSCVNKIVYLDSDLVLVDDITKLAATPLVNDAVLAAPEYCNANSTSYFTPTFWSNPSLSLTFANRRPCYFNTGVMVIDDPVFRALFGSFFALDRALFCVLACVCVWEDTLWVCKLRRTLGKVRPPRVKEVKSLRLPWQDI